MCEKIVGLVQALYTDTNSCVAVDGVCALTGSWSLLEYARSVLLLALVDWLMQHTLERSPLRVNVRCQEFRVPRLRQAFRTDLLHILTLGLRVMGEEASMLGLQVNWAKIIRLIGDPVPQVIDAGSCQV